MLAIKYLSLSLLIISILFFIVILIISKNSNYPVKNDNNHKFCILIPARYESNVIEDLLISIKNQSFKINMRDVYVIVESTKDKTVEICKKYNASVVIRKRLDLKTKGYALDEGIRYIKSKSKHYDAYFIFDADNILDKDFIKNMIPIYDKGYDLACGYRNCKNGNDSAIAASSALTFSLINEIINKMKCKHNKNITFSGTGFYIRGYLIDKFNGYPFNSLTEDYELTMYATLSDLTSFYNDKSVFYDEQPIKFKNTINQRVRWIKGYFLIRRKYAFKIFKSINKNSKNNASKIDQSIGILPYLTMVLSALFYLLYLIIKKDIFKIIIILLSIYFVLLLITLVLLILENGKIKLDKTMKIKVLFVNPIYLVSYLYCALIALFKKDVSWTVVKHGKN